MQSRSNKKKLTLKCKEKTNISKECVISKYISELLFSFDNMLRSNVYPCRASEAIEIEIDNTKIILYKSTPHTKPTYTFTSKTPNQIEKNPW